MFGYEYLLKWKWPHIYIFKKLRKVLDFRKIQCYTLFVGYESKEDTPVPISNTEVKLLYAEDSVSENRK